MLLSGDISTRIGPDTVTRTIDSIEDGDVAEYSEDTTQFTPSTQTFAVDGSYVLNGDDASGGYFQIVSQPGDGLVYYPQRGDKFKYYFRSTNTAATKSITGAIWASQNLGDDRYLTYPRMHSDTFQLREYVAGSLNTYDSVAVTFQDNTTYEVVIDFDSSNNGTITADVYDYDAGTLENTASITSSNTDNGAFGWLKENNGSTTYTDYAFIEDPFPRVLEDWESGTKANWPGGNGGFTVANDTTIEGSWNLERSSSFDSLFSFPGDGLPEYYNRGEAIAYDFHYTSGSDGTSGIYFGAVDESNNYFTRWNGSLQLVKKVGGTNTTLRSDSNVTIPSGTRIRFELFWDDGSKGGTTGDMELAVFDTSNGSELGRIATNSTDVESTTGSNGNGLGWWYNDTNTTKLDYLRKIYW